MSINKNALITMAALLALASLVGCTSIRHKATYRKTTASYPCLNCLPPSYDSTSFVLSRFESEPIADFLRVSLVRDYRWAYGDRELRIDREEDARRRELAIAWVPYNNRERYIQWSFDGLGWRDPFRNQDREMWGKIIDKTEPLSPDHEVDEMMDRLYGPPARERQEHRGRRECRER